MQILRENPMTIRIRSGRHCTYEDVKFMLLPNALHSRKYYQVQTVISD